jgi:NAD(P)-dependent dehydrogenase (short-subunit alcohol dehydrogenase family)
VRAPFLLSQVFGRAMARSGWGRIIHIGSSSAYGGFPNTILYCSSKHALLGLSRALHSELKGRGVRSYCISPGSVQTDMGRLVPGQNFETFISPEDVAEYAGFLASFNGNVVSEEIRLNRMRVQ